MNQFSHGPVKLWDTPVTPVPVAPAPTPPPPLSPIQKATQAQNTSGGPGQVQAILDQLNALKAQVTSGQLSVTGFQQQASPLVQSAAQITGDYARGGSNAANAVNPIWQRIVDNNYVASRAGKWVSTLPFSSQEYAQLPESVLPSQKDVQNGLFDPSTAPSQRYQNTAPTAPPSVSIVPPVAGPQPTDRNLNTLPVPGETNPNTGAPVTQPGTPTPLPQVTPQLPPGLDTRTEQGQVALQGQSNAATLQDALNKQYQTNNLAVNQLAQGLQGIPGVYKQEGASEQQQLLELADKQKSARSQALTDMAGLLATNQQNLFNRAIPNLAEQANTSGIYRSTGFGDILANKYANLTQDTQQQLAMQGLSDRDAYLQAQSGALNQGLGWQGQAANTQGQNQTNIAGAGASALQSYGSGLGDVANAAIGMQNAGLQRQFSLSDYITNQNAANALASKMAPPSATGKASPGTQAGISTALGVAGIAQKGAAAGKAA